MKTLRELPPAEGPHLERILTLSDADADALLALEKRMGVRCWEVIDDAKPGTDVPDTDVPGTDVPTTPTKPNGTNAKQSVRQKGNR